LTKHELAYCLGPLLHIWMGHCLKTAKSSVCVTSHCGQLSLLSLLVW